MIHREILGENEKTEQENSSKNRQRRLPKIKKKSMKKWNAGDKTWEYKKSINK